MSAFLGKIHYWLFKKIKWFEGIEGSIRDMAEEEGLDIHLWVKDIEARYGSPTEDRPLEELIDTSNIHGWLQDKIDRAEGRQAEYITRILKNKPELMNKLEIIFSSKGTEEGKYYSLNNEVNSPEEVFGAINDFILEGMPCDRVNEILVRDEDKLIYRATRCIHTPYWQSAGGEVSNFYHLRRKWISAFVKEISKDFKYVVFEDGSEGIIKR